MRDDFWRTPAGSEVTRMLQEHYPEILKTIKEHGIMLRKIDPKRSADLLDLADDLYIRRDSEKVHIITGDER